jgi:hypothetical protein
VIAGKGDQQPGKFQPILSDQGWAVQDLRTGKIYRDKRLGTMTSEQAEVLASHLCLQQGQELPETTISIKLDEPTSIYPKTKQPASRRGTTSSDSTKFIRVVLALLACVVSFAAGYYYRHPGSVKQPNGLHNILPLRSRDSRQVFLVGRVSSEDIYNRTPGYAIVSKMQEPITINRITFNDDADAIIAIRSDPYIKYLRPDPSTRFPVRLTIGEALAIMEAPYRKNIIFIKIYTNEGTFTFDGRGQPEDK